MELDKELLWRRLQRSAFRRKFTLSEKDRLYLVEKGSAVIITHAQAFIAQRLAPAHPHNDGKQTPWRGHPVFIAQHTTGTCCRSCLEKWHHIPKGRVLTEEEQDYIIKVIIFWLSRKFREKE